MGHDNDGGERGRPRRYTVIRLLLAAGLLTVVGGALTAALAGFGHRWGWWHFSTGFFILRWGVYATIAGVGASAVALLSAALLKGRWLVMAALPAIALGAVVISVPLEHRQRARDAPPIHDISTDLGDPPAFVALRPAREAAPNAVEYPGEKTAEQQRQAYPHIEPLNIEAPAEEVFAQVAALVEARGWTISEADAERGRLEATARTVWFGFEDDIVIRVAEANGGTRVDIRSASRVGRGDAGTNARRIEAFLNDLASQ